MQLSGSGRFLAFDRVESGWVTGSSWTPDDETWATWASGWVDGAYWRVAGLAADAGGGVSAPRRLFVSGGPAVLRLLVPTSFGDGPAWDALVDGAGPVGRIVAGMGTGPGAVSVEGIAAAQAAGIGVLGFVETDGGARALADAESDVGAWMDAYGADGVVLGGVPGGGDCTQERYYRRLIDAARADDPGAPVVLHAGGAACAGLASTTELVVFAGSGADFLTSDLPVGLDGWGSGARAALTWSVSRLRLDAVLGRAVDLEMGWLAVSAADASDSWSALPAWWDEVLQAVEATWETNALVGDTAAGDTAAGDTAAGDTAAGDTAAGDTAAGTGSTPPAPSPWEDAPGVLRLGPPAGSVGIYDLVAHPDGDRLFVSNLHVPFVTVADADSGAWIDAIDLTTAGATASVLPRLMLDGRTLWVSDVEGWVFWRFDVDSYAPLPPVTTDAEPTAMRATDDGAWIALADRRAVHFVDGVAVEELPLPFAPTAIDVGPTGLALADEVTDSVAVVGYDGRVAWRASTGPGMLGDVRWFADKVWATDRQTGEVLRFGRGTVELAVCTGSDTFSLTPDDAQLLVVNRQGASFPPSGAYEGAPSLVTALDPAGSTLWQVEVGKTAHFPTFDGEHWWVANEDSLDLSAIDASVGVEVTRGPKVGLSLDHVVEDDVGRLWMGSHLTDEVWVTDPADATAVPTCGWPFVTVLGEGAAWLPCQENGDVLVVDPATLLPIEQYDLADTFHPTCVDGLCTSHTEFVDAAWTSGGLVLSDPHLPGLRWTDGRTVGWTLSAGSPSTPIHLGVGEADGTVLAWDPRGAVLRGFVGDAEVGVLSPVGTPAALPIVADGAEVWVASERVNATVSRTAALPEGVVVVAAGAGWVVATEADQLVVYDSGTLAEAARLSLSELRVPPLGHRGDQLGAMRYAVGSDGALFVVNSFRGTVERRSLPDLLALGTDEIRTVGAWAALPGLR